MNPSGPNIPKNFWDQLSCKCFNVVIQPIEGFEPRSNSFNLGINYESGKNSKPDFNNRRNKDDDLGKGPLICPCCGYNLTNKLTNPTDPKETLLNREKVAKAKEKEVISAFTKSSYLRKNNDSATVISRTSLPNKISDKRLYKHRKDFNSRTVETPQPQSPTATTVCDSNYRLNTRLNTGYRTLSELLRVDNGQHPKNSSDFDNEWTRKKDEDQVEKIKTRENDQKDSSPRGTFHREWSRQKDGQQKREAGRDDQNEIKNDDNKSTAKSHSSKIVMAEQNNSRTYLRNHRIVQNMRNCWEHYLHLKLSNLRDDENWEQTDHDLIPPSFQDAPPVRTRESKNNLQQFSSSKVEMSQTMFIENKNVENLNKKNTSTNLDDKNQDGYSQCSKNCPRIEKLERDGEKNRTFEEIRHEFEMCAVEYMERMERNRTDETFMNSSNKINKTHENSKMIISSEEKVKNWMDLNDKLSQNSALNVPQNQAQNNSNTREKYMNFIQLATMPTLASQYENDGKNIEYINDIRDKVNYAIKNRPINASRKQFLPPVPTLDESHVLETVNRS